MRPGAHPLHCQATCQDAQSDEDEAALVAVKKSAKSKRLDMVKWVAAYDAWALAAASVGCLPYPAAKPTFASPSKCHVSMCSVSLQYALVSRAPFIAAGRSDAEKRRHQLGQFYDEYCRKDWAERSARGDVCFARCILSICMCGRPASAGDTDFDIRVACNRLDEELLTQARAAYDIEYSPKADAKGSGEKEKHNESGELPCTQPPCISARGHFQVPQGASAVGHASVLGAMPRKVGAKAAASMVATIRRNTSFRVPHRGKTGIGNGMSSCHDVAWGSFSPACTRTHWPLTPRRSREAEETWDACYE